MPCTKDKDKNPPFVQVKTHARTMSTLSSPLRWGILSTGRIAGVFAKAVAAVPEFGRVVAVASRDQGKASSFAKERGIAKAHGSYASLLADPEVQAVYIGTPHTEHAALSLAALEAGKHVLCEKPAAMNRFQFEKVLAKAREKGLLFMEAFMYRCHPQTKRVCELLRGGLIGQLGLAQGAFGFARPADPAHRLWSKELGGGGILDVGCYPVSWSRLLGGIAQGKSFANPVEVSGYARLHPEIGVDTVAAATLRFEGGFIAQVSCSIELAQENSLRIYGSTGWLELSSPFVLEYSGMTPRITLQRPGQAPEDLSVPCERDLYTHEVEVFAKALAAGKTETEEMSLMDTLGNLASLDAWRKSAGLIYAQD